VTPNVVVIEESAQARELVPVFIDKFRPCAVNDAQSVDHSALRVLVEVHIRYLLCGVYCDHARSLVVCTLRVQSSALSAEHRAPQTVREVEADLEKV